MTGIYTTSTAPYAVCCGNAALQIDNSPVTGGFYHYMELSCYPANDLYSPAILRAKAAELMALASRIEELTALDIMED